MTSVTIADESSHTFSITNIYDITYETVSKNKYYPIPSGNHISIHLGTEGARLTFSGYINSASDWSSLENIDLHDKVTISSSDLTDIPSSTKWLIDKKRTKRSKGFVNQWIVTIEMTRDYST
jgi:hypothetical protein